MSALAWDDLLGQPYALHGAGGGYDCSTVAETVLRRLGSEPPPTSPFRIASSAGTQEEFEQYLAEGAAQYVKLGESIGHATREGDLLLVAHGVSLVGRGMYVLVNARTGTFLTASPSSGVVATSRAAITRLRQRVLGVYRLR